MWSFGRHEGFRSNLVPGTGSLFARDLALKFNRPVASGLGLESLASEAVVGSVEARYGIYQEPQISRAVV